MLQGEDWGVIHVGMTASEVVARFEAHSDNLVTAHFPHKTALVGPQDLPYFTEDLRKLKRKRQRAYRKGKRSALYIRLKAQFEEKLLKEAMKYKERIFNEVREG